MEKKIKETSKLVKITEYEFKLLKIYERDCKALMKFLSINHGDIYNSFIEFKLKKIEDKIIVRG
jgi:hypothetical protein